MKKMIKKALVVALCLALSVEIISVNTFVGEAKPLIVVQRAGDVIPGEINVLLKEQYYTLEGPYLDIREILPEIEIESYTDLMLSAIIYGKTPKDDLDDDVVADVGKQFGITLKEKSAEAAIHAAELLNNNPYVKWAGPNVYLEFADTTPNDPYYAPALGTQQWGLMKIDAPEAWDYVTGSNTTDGSELGNYVRVAVMDTGVDDQHPDLVNNVNMSLAYNAYSIAHYQMPDNTTDVYGHGTHVAGIIGAEGNNSIGVAGVCWNVEIIPIKIIDDLTGYSSPEAITEAIDYARTKRIKIANLSFSLGYDADMFDAIEHYTECGGLLVVAAGNFSANLNNSTTYSYLHSIDGVIIVGALDDDMTSDLPCSLSNYGSNVVDLFAPGENIMSTVPYAISSDGYDTDDGTSMAAPFVTGTAALLKAANTMLTADDIIEAILDNVVTSSDLTNYCSTGGRLSIPDALYSLGYQVIISNTMTHGTVRPSAVFTNPNTIVYLTAYPDSGYMLKPGSMKHNSYNTITVNKWRTFFAMPYSNDTITAQFYMVGDIDLDEAVTVADALEALRHSAGQITLTGDALLAADVDGDGDVDNDDAQTIQNYAAHIIDHFPIEE